MFPPLYTVLPASAYAGVTKSNDSVSSRLNPTHVNGTLMLKE